MKKSPYIVLEESRPALQAWLRKRYERKPSLKFYFQNHWACSNKRGGHAILFGFQWGHGDYNFTEDLSVDICVFGFTFGVTFILKPRHVL